MVKNADGQLCTGNLGDPVINQTFGAGHGFVMPANATIFQKANSCPSKGEYLISNFVFGCGNNNDKSWIKMIGDHTHDYNGNYMLVNGENTPGVVYTDTAKGLCANMTYVFAAWISNAMQSFTCGGNPALAKLDFAVSKPDGTILASATSGEIPVADDRVWKQYGVSFVNPPGNDYVIVTITNTSRPGCGAGFVMDDITFRSCGPAVTVTLDGNTGAANVCADYTQPFILQGSYSPGFSDPVVQWQSSTDTGKTWQDISGETSLTYAIPRRMTGVINYRMVVAERAYMASPGCRIASNDIYTEIHPVPLHSAPQHTFGCLDKDLLLPATDPSALSVAWTGPNGYYSADPISVVPSMQYADTGLYERIQNFNFGCSTHDSLYVKVYPGTTISAAPVHPVCEGMSQQLSVSASGGGTFQWYPSTGLSNDKIPDPIAAPKDTALYKVVVTNSYGCKDSAFLNIDVYRNLSISAGPDKVILAGDTAILSATIKGTAVEYSWSPSMYLSDVNAIAPRAFPPQSVEYTLNAISAVGCGSGSDKVWVKVYNDFNIPSAFTPNGDGKNDKFQVLPLDNYQLVRFNIFNRFGQLIFSSTNGYKGWDGRYNSVDQPTGVYVYQLEMVNAQGKRIVKQGTVTLLR